ncbi:DUF402 domain-containing protein [Saccharopolyspora sp. MS10]|uniref:DUF402 domain-containing protein n=1 Tax=Saccharopolyspora sp. MS10 TaxID=3385973 RepID=UPI00399F6805
MTTQREIAASLGLPVHPPKSEIFDLGAGTNTDPKGVVREVAEFRREPFGLYLRRAMPGHPKLSALESWLLPELDLRITRWEYHPGHTCDGDHYVDVARVEPGSERWRTTDLYLDVLVTEGRDARLLDVDEFVRAVRAELLDEATSELAMRTACGVVEGLARHDYRMDEWLRSRGVELSWSARSERDPAIRSSAVPPNR